MFLASRRCLFGLKRWLDIPTYGFGSERAVTSVAAFLFVAHNMAVEYVIYYVILHLYGSNMAAKIHKATLENRG